MKKTLLLFIVLIMVTHMAMAQIKGKFAVGAGFQGNINTIYGLAISGAIGMDYGLTDVLAIGTRVALSYNFGNITTVEPEIFIRGYFKRTGIVDIFFQSDIGASLIFEDRDFYPVILGGQMIGMRFSLDKHWWAEPFLRFGYPFAAGIGVMAGYRF